MKARLLAKRYVLPHIRMPGDLLAPLAGQFPRVGVAEQSIGTFGFECPRKDDPSGSIGNRADQAFFHGQSFLALTPMIVDNLHHGGMAAPIDIASGKICGAAILQGKQFGNSVFDKHPDTGIKFDGFHLPYWPHVLDLARKAHLAFPSMHFIGWDIAILQQPPVLDEANPWWGIELNVTPHGLSVADTQFVPYYNHYFRKRPSANPAPPEWPV